MLEFVHRLFGRSRSNLSVPILDGAFKPNNLLEDAEVILEKPGLEDMALAPDGRLFLAAGSEVLAFDGKFTQVIARHDGLITALAVLADGRHAVALGDRIIVQGQPPITRAVDRSFKAITALTPDSGDRILVCDASADHACDKWQYDLMNKGNTGRLVIMDPVSGNANLLHSKLGWPCGALPTGTGTLVSESWRHRLHWAGKGDASVELPGYPARITSTADGGFWLSLFSGRAQIVEFILSENVFRAEMMTTIDPKYWVCPALSSGEDFLEPMQSGGVKNMGILKPWAPPRSYGLAVRFTADRNPLMSIHSRVGGRNHGIVTTLEKGNDIYALSKGAGRLLRLNLQAIRAANGLEGSAK